MADIAVDATAGAGQANARAVWGPYWISDLIGVMSGRDGGVDASFYRTDDGGLTWTPLEVEGGQCVQIACWFDRQTPGITTDLVHIVWLDSTAGDFTYANINVTTGSVSTPVDINASASVNATAQNNFCYVGRSRNGRLYAGHVNSATGSGAFESDDEGATWGASDNPFESNALDEPHFFPANTGDGKDYGLLFGDVSAGEVTAKMYDESAGTFTETVLATGVTFDVATAYMMSLGVRLSDGHVIAAILTQVNNAGADVRVFDINPTTIATVSNTELTNAWTDVDNAGAPSIFIDQSQDFLYVALAIGATQDFAAGGADCNVWRKLSDDAGTSWEAAVDISEQTPDDLRPLSLGTAMASSTSGGWVMFGWADADDAGLFVNVSTAIQITAGANEYMETLLGDMPASSGALTRHGEFARSYTGDMPAAASLLIYCVDISEQIPLIRRYISYMRRKRASN